MDVTSTKADPLAAEYAALPFYKQGWFFQTLAVVGLIVPGDFPLIIVIIAIVVGFVVYSILSAVFSMTQSLQFRPR